MTQRTTRIAAALIGAVGVAFAAGCASPPQALEQAQSAYQEASDDPVVQQYAPVPLYEARQTLNRAEREWEEDENAAETAHLAYLAETRVKIARAQAQREQARAKVDQLAQERDEVLLQARREELQTARTLAQQGRQAAARERQRAEQLEETLQDQQRRQQFDQELEMALAEQLKELQPRETERGLVLTLGSDVLFAFDEDDLKSGSQRNLARLVDFLRENPERNLLIEGYTDDVGSEAYNEDLSQRRANAVRDFLVVNGIDPSRLTVQGYGEDYPRVANQSPEARQMNRRVEVVVLDRGQRGGEMAREGRQPTARPAALPRQGTDAGSAEGAGTPAPGTPMQPGTQPGTQPATQEQENPYPTMQ